MTGAVGSDDGEGAESLIDVLDGLVCALPDDEFLSGLPALRQAFAFFRRASGTGSPAVCWNGAGCAARRVPCCGPPRTPC